MPGPLPAPIELTAEEAEGLATLVRRHTAPQQLGARARIVLLAADGLNNCEIARQLGLDVETVRLWRQRWRGWAGVAPADLSIAERLADAPRTGRPARITAEQYCQLIALAGEAPSTAGRPLSQGSGRELADDIVARGIVAAISPRHAARLLKRGTSHRTACTTG
jgi:Homeodomain-like domain-containing protein